MAGRAKAAGAHVRRNAIAYIAVFAAVAGGTAWALERNSVRSKHIAKNAVRDSDVRDTRVRAVKPNPAVPADPCEAGRSGVFCGNFDDSPDDGFWRNVDGGYAPATYRKDPAGTVYLSGSVTATTSQVPLSMFRLPRAFRPARSHVFATGCRSVVDQQFEFCGALVAADGSVQWSLDGTFPRAGIWLDGISFPAR